MQKIKWWVHWWLVSFMFCEASFQTSLNQQCRNSTNNMPDARKCMKHVHEVLLNGSDVDSFTRAIETLEDILEETEEDYNTSLYESNFLTLLHKPKDFSQGLEIHATDDKADLCDTFPKSIVSVRLPRELDAGPNNKIVFCMFKWPEEKKIFGTPHALYDRRLIGLSVQGKNISGLRESVSITIELTKDINETQQPSCQFFNFSTSSFREDGCQTNWTRGQTNITCSCNHLTYFGVLMVNTPVSPKDQKILTYITLIGCSLSLSALVIALFLFITNRKLRGDVSMKVHISVVTALSLLNLHFLINQTLAATSSSGLCLYMALLLHYSLLATFSWMALEGFHLYLLLIKVFNIYVKRYLLKLSVVGWGVPAIIVSVVVIIDRNNYGLVSLSVSNSSDTALCYVKSHYVNMGITDGLFSLVFLFNMIMFIVTVRHVLIAHRGQEFGQSNRDRAKKDICTMLGVLTLLGITWGLVFFSFGPLTTPVLYLFCILNSLQGFFIFLWFVMSLRKAKNSATKTSSETQNTST